MGQKYLTWQQVVAILCVPALLVGAGLAFGPNTSRGDRSAGWWIIIVALPTLLGVIASHRLTYHRRDLVPDILIQIVDPQRVLQLDDAHVWLGAAQAGPFLAVTVVVQNLRDGPGDLRLKLRPESGRACLACGVPEVPIPLEAAEVAAAVIAFPLCALDQPASIKFSVGGRCKTGGPRVRFARRAAVTTRVHPIFTILAALAGHIVHGGGTFLEARLTPVPSPPGDSKLRCSAATVWAPRDPVEPAVVVERLRAFVDDELRALSDGAGTRPTAQSDRITK